MSLLTSIGSETGFTTTKCQGGISTVASESARRVVHLEFPERMTAAAPCGSVIGVVRMLALGRYLSLRAMMFSAATGPSISEAVQSRAPS
ncbi:hypothetical protein D3C85_1797560 [compost metagenome]